MLTTFSTGQTNFALSDFGTAPDPFNPVVTSYNTFQWDNPSTPAALRFTFNSRATIPEPGTLVLLLVPGAATLRRRTGRKIA